MRSFGRSRRATEQAVLQDAAHRDDIVKVADELNRSLSRFKLASA